AEMQQLMKNLGAKADPSSLPAPNESVKKCEVMNPVRALALRAEAYRILGVDLTTIPGVSVLHVQTILPSWDRTSQSFAARPRSVRGWDCVRTMTLVVGKCWGAEPEGSRTASPLPSAWQPNPFSTANRRWASSIDGCGPSWAPPKQSPLPPTNW